MNSVNLRSVPATIGQVHATTGRVHATVSRVPATVDPMPLTVGRRRGRMPQSITHVSYFIESNLVPRICFTNESDMSDGL
jgi:hypothetical protein